MGVQSDGGGDLLSGTGSLDEGGNGNAGDNHSQDQGGNPSTGDDKAGNESDGGVAGNQDTQTQRPAWMAQLPEDQKESESLTKFQSIGELGKAYSELEGKLGESVTPPGEDATDEERSNFYKKLGRPDTPEGYKVKFPESYSQEVVDAYRKTAFEMGLNDKQFGGFMKTMGLQALATTEKMKAMQTAEQEAAVKALKDDWGESFDANNALAQRTLINYGGEQIKKEFQAAGLGNSVPLMNFLKAVGADLVEHKVIDGKVGGEGRDPDRLYYD